MTSTDHRKSGRREEGILARTPELERLLASLRRRALRSVLLHGFGLFLVIACGWLLFSFAADYWLRVPRALRLFHGLVLGALAVASLWRFVVRPMGKIPGRSGLAILIEKKHPSLHELFSSATQFQAAPGQAAPASYHGDPDLVERVLSAADARSNKFDLDGVVESRPGVRRFVMGTGATLLLLLLALTHPLQTRIYLAHLLGSSLTWPQRTHLVVEIPDLGQGSEIERSSERVRARVARGTDVPVVVRASGVIPEEVLLHFNAGRDLALKHAGAGVFRTLLSSLQEDVAFHATGGDDERGLPRIEISVLQPPDLAGLAIRVVPPAYCGLPESLVFDRDVEALVGSRLHVHVLPSPADATGVVRLLPEDRAEALVQSSFPSNPARGDEGLSNAAGLGFEITLERSLGMRFELSDSSGLTNPDPGLFRATALEDRGPEVRVLAPARADVEVVLGGALRLSAIVQDDFGLSGARIVAQVETGSTASVLIDEALELALVLDAVESADSTRQARKALVTRRFDVSSFGTSERPASVDERVVLEIIARDNRTPAGVEGRAAPVRARIVTPEELLRRVQERMAQARASTSRLVELTRNKRARVAELVQALSSALDGGGDDALGLSSALTGERRVLSDARTLMRDVALVTEDVLYARLDEKAGRLLEAHDARAAVTTEPESDPTPWQELVREAAALPASETGLAKNLIELVGLTLEIAFEHETAAVGALERAEKASEPTAALEALIGASEAQRRAAESLELLLEKLAEWDNFQSVLMQARDLLNREKSLLGRTQRHAAEDRR